MKFVTNKDWGITLKTVGDILLVMGPVLLIPGVASIFYDINRAVFFITPGLLCSLFGFGLRKKFRSESIMHTKHAMLAAALVWIIIPLFGTIPFIANGFSFLDSYFESISGFTTTGMTLMQNIESYPEPLLLFRSFMQWIGGVGIIVLFLLILTRPGAGSYLYQSETRSDRIKPSTKGTAIEIWKIYGFYTLACLIFLLIAGMPLFDAVNHSMATISTGGISTKDASAGAFNDLVFVKPVMILFMLIGSISFFIHFRVLDGNFKTIIRSEEFRFMIGLILIATILITARISLEENLSGGLSGIEDILFQVVAMITSTGFTTIDVTTWDSFTQIIILILMIMGGCYGSTTGGLKMLRVLILWKTMWKRIKKSLMPEAAVVPVTVMGKPLRDEDISFVTGLAVAYFLLVILGALVFAALDYTPLESMSASVSAVSNVGPTFIPNDEWFNIGSIEKITLIILIYAGRLEIFPMLVLVTVLIKRGNI